MVRATSVECSQCQQRIAPGERFVSFKIPGKESYQFLPSPIAPPETAGRITSRRTGEDSRAGTCVPQPAGDINRAIHSDSGSRQE